MYSIGIDRFNANNFDSGAIALRTPEINPPPPTKMACIGCWYCCTSMPTVPLSGNSQTGSQRGVCQLFPPPVDGIGIASSVSPSNTTSPPRALDCIHQGVVTGMTIIASCSDGQHDSWVWFLQRAIAPCASLSGGSCTILL